MKAGFMPAFFVAAGGYLGMYKYNDIDLSNAPHPPLSAHRRIRRGEKVRGGEGELCEFYRLLMNLIVNSMG
jgi:hypothetical protein